MPTDGRSLLDDWGDSALARDQERQEIAEAGSLWLPPGREALEHERDLTDAHRNSLSGRFTPHPGLTVTEPARLTADVSGQPTTYVTLSPRDDLADSGAFQSAAPSGWRIEHLKSGHWPMLSRPEDVVDLIAREVVRYGVGRG